MSIAPVSGFGTAKWIVSATAGQGTHTTIAGALTAASSGDTIFVRPGTYTENPTLKAGVNLSAYSCDAQTPNVTISGKCTFTGAGTVTFSGINLQTNSDFALAITGSAASVVILQSCFITCLNNTGISYTTSSGSAALTMYNCVTQLSTTGIGLFSASSAGSFNIYNTSMNNAGASTTATTTSATAVGFFNSEFAMPLTTSSTGLFNILSCSCDCSAVNTAVLTTAGTGPSSILNSKIASGTASALSAGSGTVIQVTNSGVNSSNTNAIAGAGTVQYGDITFLGTSSKISTTTQTILVSSTFQSTSNQVFTVTGTYTPTSGMKYCSVQCLGGGGAGGGAAITGASQYSVGAGGGAGEYAVGIFTAATIGTSQAVTIGAGGTGVSGGTGNTGGTTSLGSLITSIGGSGAAAAAAAIVVISLGGAGGTGGTGGDYRGPGATGLVSVGSVTIGSLYGNSGGSTILGSGGAVGVGGAGNAATGYGAGGGGASSLANTGATRAGGNGAPGIVIVTEYF